MSHLIKPLCRVKFLLRKLQEVETLIMQDDAIAEVAHLIEAGGEIEDKRCRLEDLLDCAGLALGAAMQGAEMPPEVANVMLLQSRASGLCNLAQQLEEAYAAYSAAAASVCSNMPKPPKRNEPSSHFKGPKRVVQHMEEGGLVDQIARTLLPR
jgi:hypothetical protein